MSLTSWAENAETKVAAFVSTEIKKIEGDVTVVQAAIGNAATLADNLVNGLKNFIESPEGKTLAGVVENIPGIGPYLFDVINFLPTLLTDLGWIKSESQTVGDTIISGLSVAVNTTNANVKATNMVALQANLNTKLSALMGAPMSIQASISQAPAVYVENALPPAPTGAAEALNAATGTAATEGAPAADTQA